MVVETFVTICALAALAMPLWVPILLAVVYRYSSYDDSAVFLEDTFELVGKVFLYTVGLPFMILLFLLALIA